MLNKGEIVKMEDFRFLRHHEGIDCRDLGRYIKNKAFYNRDIEVNTIINDSDLGVTFSK